MYSFEYDNEKSSLNKVKHGIDFLESQTLWADPNAIEIRAKCVKEPRFLVIGLIDKKHWSAVVTYRGENIRIISVRRSRKAEVKLYEN